MRFFLAWLPLALLGVGVDAAFCQQSTTVQLPTYSSFSTRGSVLVPDRGSAYLGGVKRAAFGRNEFGAPLSPFRNRSFGAERSVSGASVSVYIHDFEAMDEYLLSQPTPFRRSQQEIAARRPRGAGVSRPAANDVWNQRLTDACAGSGGPASMSVAELRAERLRVEETRHAEALKWFKRGQGVEAAGKANVARVYYQMAARRATGELKDEIAARLEAVSGSPAASKLVRSRP
ncbi:MAG: hypothetical protein ABIK89_07120 [Planctomycetota bacterium]